MRGFAVATCFVLAILLLPFALVGVWVQRVALDRDRFVDLSDELLDQEAVRLALADSLTDELAQRGDLPRSLQEQFDPLIAELFTRASVQAGFGVAMGQLHDELEAGDDTLTLDLTPAAAAASAEIAAIDPRLAAAIPTGTELPPVVVAQRDDVPLVWNLVEVARRLAIVAPVAVVVLLGAAVALAQHRGRTLALAGLTITAMSLALLAILTVTREVIAGGVSRVTASDAVAATWSVLQRSLTGQVVLVAGVGAVVAVGGLVYELARRR